MLGRISIDSNVCFGLDLLAGGMSVPEILEEYPSLEEADVRACIAYGAEMSRERYVEIPGGGG